MKTFDKFNDFSELLRDYSKHFADGDADVRSACDHLVAVFDAAMKTDNPREAFVKQLESDGSYSSWKNK